MAELTEWQKRRGILAPKPKKKSKSVQRRESVQKKESSPKGEG